ncbi:unnamed protein product [Triticum turgidum subsp. durum]|uniref:Glycosyl-hydrolase family 116 N-terminal domain-containing protein n=1 Tax=Triticum turgidum subsp. durum TaxID=4567 RepID=A0A9R0QTU6_TRITD|nr:unnamed protein product [Triticum turgidum subsp. durum]
MPRGKSSSGGSLFYRRKHSWRRDELVSRSTLHLLDFDDGTPPEHAWRRKLSSHANRLKEFNVTFREAFKMMKLGLRLWSYVREEASQGRKAPIDPFTRESSKPSASQGVPLGGMGTGSISRGFRGEFKHWQITPGSCDMSPVMENQFSVTETFYPAKHAISSLFSQFHYFSLLLIHIVMDPNFEQYFMMNLMRCTC